MALLVDQTAAVYTCYHCGLNSTASSFRYFDNKKVDQPRHQCQHCRKLFTLGFHGRPRGKPYAKKRNEDPVELRSLSRQCRHCGVSDNARFKFYNNGNPLQPRFQCVSCGKQFQMRLVNAGDAASLVHTWLNPSHAPRRSKKQGLQRASEMTSNVEDGQPAALSEADLLDEPEPRGADPISCDADAGVDGLLPQSSVEDALFRDPLELCENEPASNAKPIPCTPNVDLESPSTPVPRMRGIWVWGLWISCCPTP